MFISAVKLVILTWRSVGIISLFGASLKRPSEELQELFGTLMLAYFSVPEVATWDKLIRINNIEPYDLAAQHCSPYCTTSTHIHRHCNLIFGLSAHSLVQEITG